MALTDLRCSSCGVALSQQGSTSFPCPECAAATIGRCPRCRDQSVHYHCSHCTFEGP